jgi:hypothetical protein
VTLGDGLRHVVYFDTDVHPRSVEFLGKVAFSNGSVETTTFEPDSRLAIYNRRGLPRRDPTSQGPGNRACRLPEVVAFE